MFKISQKSKLAEKTHWIEIEAPEIAVKSKAGQFVMLMIDEKSEKIPLTLADMGKKTITFVVLEAGKTTQELAKLKKGSSIFSLTGPLGSPSEIKQYGKVCLIGGGLGIATIYPIAKALKAQKNEITIIIGAKNKKFLFWEDKLKKASKKLIVCTDDGSKGKKGVVTDALKSLMENDRPSRVIAIGPPIMMKAISDMTRNRIKTIVSLNPIMINGKTKFACVDGPEFDAHSVDFDSLINRNTTYAEEERHCQK